MCRELGYPRGDSSTNLAPSFTTCPQNIEILERKNLNKIVACAKANLYSLVGCDPSSVYVNLDAQKYKLQ